MIIDPLKFFSESSQQHRRALYALNMALASNGLPHYHRGLNRFNTGDYTAYPTPRRLFKYRFPFGFTLELEQIYLLYRTGTAEAKDLIYVVSTGVLTIAPGRQEP
jgi:hypothetical protein